MKKLSYATDVDDSTINRFSIEDDDEEDEYLSDNRPLNTYYSI